MIWEFKRQLYCSSKLVSLDATQVSTDSAVQSLLQQYFDDDGTFPTLGSQDEYASYFERAYPTQRDRQSFIEQQMLLGRPSNGHHALAKLVKMDRARVIWTTNFDPLIEDAIAQAYGTTANLVTATLGEPSLAIESLNASRWPLLGKLHGDFRSQRLKNIPDELRNQDGELRRGFMEGCHRLGLAIVGYSGRDSSIMEALREAIDQGNGFPNGLYWFYRAGTTPHPSVTQLVEDARLACIESYLIPFDSFDALLTDIATFEATERPTITIAQPIAAQVNLLDSGIESHSFRLDAKPPATTFVGRSTELSNIQQAFDRSTSSIKSYAIHGLSGMGKSELARKYIEHSRGTYKHVFWVRGSDNLTVVSDLAAIAGSMGMADFDPVNQNVAAHAAVRGLAILDNWLLVFDAALPHVVRQYWPRQGRGHVLITSISPNWSSLASNIIQLSGLDIDDATQMLLSRSGQSDATTAKHIAASLGTLPLALEQVSAFLETTQTSLPEYRQLLEDHRADLLNRTSEFSDYPESVYGVLALTVERVKGENESALTLLAFLSILTSDLVPKWFPKILLKEQKGRAGQQFDDVIYANMVGNLMSYSLIASTPEHLASHTLVQAYVRDGWTANECHGLSSFVLTALTFVYPEGESSANWPRCEELIDQVASAVKYLDLERVDDPFIEALLNNAGLYLHFRGRNDEGAALLALSISIARANYAEDDPRLIRALINLADSSHSTDKAVDSEQILLEGIKAMEKHGTDSPDDADLLGRAHSNLGSLYLDRGKLDQAEERFLIAQAIHSKALGGQHHSTAIDTQNLGRVYREQGHWKDAYDCFQTSVDVLLNSLGARDYRVGSALYARASAAFNLHLFEETLSDLAGAVSVFDDVYAGTNHPLLVEALASSATVLHLTGDFHGALKMYDRAIPMHRSRFGRNNPNVKNLQRDRGEAATKAVLSLISKTDAIWTFHTSMVGDLRYFEGRGYGLVPKEYISFFSPQYQLDQSPFLYENG